MEVIKRIIPRKNFRKYNIPERFGEKAELIILPYKDDESSVEDDYNSWDLMKAQEKNGSMDMLNEPEEEAWNEV
jgi:hypothetical protein